jgi:hypothetical protein
MKLSLAARFLFGAIQKLGERVQEQKLETEVWNVEPVYGVSGDEGYTIFAIFDPEWRDRMLDAWAKELAKLRGPYRLLQEADYTIGRPVFFFKIPDKDWHI